MIKRYLTVAGVAQRISTGTNDPLLEPTQHPEQMPSLNAAFCGTPSWTRVALTMPGLALLSCARYPKENLAPAKCENDQPWNTPGDCELEKCPQLRSGWAGVASGLDRHRVGPENRSKEANWGVPGPE